MTEPELEKILKSIETALEVFRTQQGKLSAAQISVKSMLLTVRQQVSHQLTRERSAATD